MTHIKVLIFFVCLFLFLPLAVHTNPLYTPDTVSGAEAETADTAKTEKSEKVKQLRSVRTSGGSPELIDMQINLRDRVGELLYSLKEGNKEATGKSAVLWSLFVFSFIYGILHAAGPGHRKTLVFSLYLTRHAPPWEPLVTACVLAFLHAGTAVTLILILKGAEISLGAAADKIGIYLEGFSYILIILTGLILLIKESVEFFVHGTCSCSRHRFSAPHSGHDHCCTTRTTEKISLMSLLISGLYPCPGAVLVLILSYTLGVLGTGITCVFIMSTGMIVPVATAAYLAWAGRGGIFQLLKKNEKKAAVVSFALEAFGYIMLVSFSFYIALPFFRNFI